MVRLAVQTRASFIPWKSHEGGGQAAPALTASVSPGAQPHREAAEDAEGRKLAQTWPPRLEVPCSASESLSRPDASSGHHRLWKRPWGPSRPIFGAQMGKLRPREGKALPTGECSGAPDSQCGAFQRSTLPFWRRADVDGQEGAARRLWEEPACGLFGNSPSVSGFCRCRKPGLSQVSFSSGCAQGEEGPCQL